MTPRAEPGLARELSSLARNLQSERNTEGAIRRVTAAAVAEIDGADAAAISVRVGRRVETHGATAPFVDRVDRAQYDTGEGPCLDSARRQRTIRCDDLATDPRWPRFTPRALDLGVRSFLSLELFNAGDSMGALNLYAHRSRAFTEADETVGLLLASHAAVAIAAHRRVANLQSAMDVRDLVGQAKGILMERCDIDDAAAFGLLAATSQNSNRKLTEVAAHLVRTRELIGTDGEHPRRS